MGARRLFMKHACKHIITKQYVNNIFVKNIKQTVLRLRELHRKLARLGPIMRGSVVRLGPYRRPIFSTKKNQKTRLVYLGEDRVQTAKTCSDNYRKLLDIVEEMTILNIVLLKQHIDPVKRLKNQEKKLAE